MRNTFQALAVTLLASCGSNASSPSQPGDQPASRPLPEPTSPTQMVASDRCEAVRDLMVDSVIHGLLAPVAYNYRYHGDMPGMPQRSAEPSVDRAEAKMEDAKSTVASGSASAGSAPVAPSAPGHYTTTNTQEKNVDEADLVKTDGKHVYTLRNSELMIAKSWPIEDTKLAARVSFRTMAPQQLYLHGDQVVVQGTASTATGQVTRVVVIDIKDRAKPFVESTYDIDGGTTSSRMVGDDLFLVQSSALQIPPKLTELGAKTIAAIPRADQQSLRPWDVQARLANELRAKLVPAITDRDIAQALPQIRTDGLRTQLSCSDLYVPQDNIQLGLTAVAKVSLGKGKDSIVGAMVSGGQVYASTEALYVTAPSYTWNGQGAASQRTAVHKFSLGGSEGRPAYVASGSVPGTVLNQFSMSEYKGDLRIATTDWSWNGQQGGNQLFVLRPHGHSLDTIGQINGLARGEQIYAGRMFGDKGYLVTFRQTDPLFTLDLSNPEKPRVAGELKINGFSSYLHPMGDDLLLAIGQDATDAGQITGLQLQVFDVSNPDKPTRKFAEKLSSWSTYSNSIAASDHHAFNYDPVSGVLAIPTAGQDDEGVQFNGLVVYGVDKKKGFELYGRVSHRQLAKEALEATCGDESDPWATHCDRSSWTYQLPQYSQIDRSIVIDRHIVTLGLAGMEIHSLDKLARREARLTWPQPATEQTRGLVVVN